MKPSRTKKKPAAGKSAKNVEPRKTKGGRVELTEEDLARVSGGENIRRVKAE